MAVLCLALGGVAGGAARRRRAAAGPQERIPSVDLRLAVAMLDEGGPAARPRGVPAPGEGGARAARPLGVPAPEGGAAGAAAVAAVRRQADRWRALWWALAGALALVPVLRAAGWVIVPAVGMAGACASLALAGGVRWRELLAGLAAVVTRAVPGVAALAGSTGRAVPVRAAAPAVRGALLAGGLLVVFVPLLTSADAAFAQIVEDVATGWSLDRPVGRIAAWLGVAATGGALVHTGLRPPVREARPPRLALTRLEWGLPLGALVALFAAFVALQLTTLFGGNRHVLQTAGLTYAEYARSGFAQLLVVAALTLAVVAAAARWARDGGRLLQALLGALCVLTLVVLASALRRLGLYEEAYGFTRLRLTAHAILLWLGALVCLVLAAGAVRGRAAWLPRAAVAVTAVGMLAFALADPDRRIADRNVDRFERTGRIDVAYLSRLGPDAAPELTRLPQACATARLRRALRRPDGLAGLNLARARARRALGAARAGYCSADDGVHARPARAR